MPNLLAKSGKNISKEKNEIVKVWFSEEDIFIELKDGRTYHKPIILYHNLSKGTPEQRLQFELWNNGRWIHWEGLDEDLSLEGFLA